MEAKKEARKVEVRKKKEEEEEEEEEEEARREETMEADTVVDDVTDQTEEVTVVDVGSTPFTSFHLLPTPFSL